MFKLRVQYLDGQVNDVVADNNTMNKAFEKILERIEENQQVISQDFYGNITIEKMNNIQ